MHAAVDVADAKQRVRAEIERLTPQLIALSHDIHDHPELNFEEHHAHEALAGMLEDNGLDVQRGAYGLATAFDARAGTGCGPLIAVCCEYDALPEIGHACGHNVIGAAGVGAGLAAAAVAESLGGRVAILGTPAEEGGGGKEFMIRRGAFDGVDAAMMVHPADRDLRTMRAVAVHTVEVAYEGLAAHAAAAPERGRNALDAAVLGYNAVAALRQHIRPDERIHGVFTNGGAKPNVVPARAETFWYVRSPKMDGLETLKDRFTACLQGGAVAAGCSMSMNWVDPPFFDMIDNSPLLEIYARNAAVLGRDLRAPDETSMVVGSTDMGNVSHKVPAIHPMIQCAPEGTAIHTEEFASFTRTEMADEALVDGALSMALSIVDCWTDPAAMDAVRAEFSTATGGVDGSDGTARAASSA